MEFATPSKKPSALTLSQAAEEKPSSSPFSPLNPSMKAIAAAAAAVAPAGQIPTPEKQAQPPRQARRRNVAFSVKEVKRAAHGLKKSVDRSAPSPTGDDLSSVEALLGAGDGSGTSTKPSKGKNLVTLPEKYEALYEFFNCMESSIRLLRLRGSTSTFPNISKSIQNLTGRRFTYAHLAQMKHLLPEAILINKVLLHDEATCCMKPELQVVLDAEALKSMNCKSESGFSVSRKVFRERLFTFIKDHPEGEEVPKGELPHPFSLNHRNQTSETNVDIVKTSTESIQPPTISGPEQKFLVPSHMSQSFQRRFTRKVPILDSEKTPLMSLAKAPENEHSASHSASPMKWNSRPPIFRKSFVASLSSLAASRSETTEDTAGFAKDKNDDTQEKVEMMCSPDLLSTPLKAKTQESQATKGLNTPIGCATPPVRSAKRSARTKLFTTPTKRAKISEEHDDILNILPESLLQSIKEKEKKATEYREAGVADAIRRQRLISSLTTTFDMILLIFQSNKRSVMTKGELIHKLISSNLKIVDRDEVEDQLNVMQELIPDWISEKTAYSGDILCSVNQISNPEEIRQRLQEAE